MKHPAKDKTDYSISVRYRQKNGEWSEWKEKGEGKWIGVDQLQNQIKMIRLAYSRDIEIKVEKDGNLLDYFGNVTEKPIQLNERTR